MKDTQKSIREDFQDFADSILWSNDDGSEKYIAVGNMADWWLSKYTQLLQTIESEIEGERKGRVEGEDREWKIHYLGYDEAIDSAKAIISKYKEK
jgi:hypothetical protein